MSAYKCLNCNSTMKDKPAKCPYCDIFLSKGMLISLIKADEKVQTENFKSAATTCWNCEAPCDSQTDECSSCGMRNPLQQPFSEKRIRDLNSSKTDTQWPQKRNTK